MATNYAATYIARLEDETRHRLDTAAREQPTLDPRSVLLVALQLRESGDEAGARSVVAAWRKSLKGEK